MCSLKHTSIFSTSNFSYSQFPLFGLIFVTSWFKQLPPSFLHRQGALRNVGRQGGIRKLEGRSKEKNENGNMKIRKWCTYFCFQFFLSCVLVSCLGFPSFLVSLNCFSPKMTGLLSKWWQWKHSVVQSLSFAAWISCFSESCSDPEEVFHYLFAHH